jgi:hypothetical protein
MGSNEIHDDFLRIEDDEGPLHPGFAVPPQLLTIATCSKKSPTFLILCGGPVDQYTPEVLSGVITELRQYLSTTIDLQMKEEAEYLKAIIDEAQKLAPPSNGLGPCVVPSRRPALPRERLVVPSLPAIGGSLLSGQKRK